MNANKFVAGGLAVAFTAPFIVPVLAPQPRSSPKVMVPRQNGLTRRPERPSVMYESSDMAVSFRVWDGPAKAAVQCPREPQAPLEGVDRCHRCLARFHQYRSGSSISAWRAKACSG